MHVYKKILLQTMEETILTTTTERDKKLRVRSISPKSFSAYITSL